MANYPVSLPSFTNPASGDYLNSPAHATQHGNNNDETVAVATKVGTGSSTPTDGVYLKGNGVGTSAWTALTINRGIGWYIAGTPSVANDLSWQPTAPQTMTCIKTWASCKTAPTDATLICSIYNITQAQVVGTVDILTTATSGNSTSYTNAAITAGDILRIDVTQVGSTIAGADISVNLELTQP